MTASSLLGLPVCDAIAALGHTVSLESDEGPVAMVDAGVPTGTIINSTPADQELTPTNGERTW